MDLKTSIIQNVYNMGISSCDSGTQYCSEGYELYFPCLKNITRGQVACFDFYVADSSTQDVADLDDVDAISLTLSGQYGCKYGTFSYPDNIYSLQKTSYDLKYSFTFDGREKYELDLMSFDTSNSEFNEYMNHKQGFFYSGTMVKVSAYDTKTHIFMGWTLFEDIDSDCEDETIEDYIISTDNIYSFIIKENTRIFALYRPRKTYDITIDNRNKNSHFNVIYKSVTYHISNIDDNIFNDGYDVLHNVLEGYSLKVECIPITSSMDSDSDNDYSYRFVEWKDGDTNRVRIFHPGIDTSYFESGGNINLFALCYGPVSPYDIEIDNTPIIDSFDEDGIHIISYSDTYSDNDEYEYTGDEYTENINNVTIKTINDETYLHINNGSLVLSSMGINEGIRIDIQAETEELCELYVKVNGNILVHTISPDDDIDKINVYSFSECDGSSIEIYTYNECLIKKIDIYKTSIEDKGKARLCLDSDTVINSDEDDIVFGDIPSGPLYVSGAIMVNGQTYGMSQVQIGIINNLNKITII